MAGALSSFQEPLIYGYFWDEGIKLHHIEGAILILPWLPH